MFDLAMVDDTLPETAGHEEGSPPDEPGTVIADRYILKALLGAGSSGFVWRAEQTKPVRRDVAVKIIRPGLVTEPVSARFNREHQVLARMEHPNIAAVFDAGELPDGRTFFAMELVDGMPITTWCVHHQADLRQRLEIFHQACLAVLHAHQKGILHRDLKPSNVLVTSASGFPLVKVIDFGIAKAICTDLTAGPDMTLRGMVLGTPRYMSPEQAGLTGQDVDTRTDVFALGIVLYELLTGTTPVGDDTGQTSSLPELLQRVRHTEAERPSRRVTRSTSTTGIPPRLPVRRLARELSGDLDWIVLKALQNDREQRYPSVSMLVDDLQRHLRNEPVSAGPPGLAYRLKKWRMRHRGALTAIAAVLCVSLAGLAATWWALHREAAQRSEAERQQRRAQKQAQLAEQVSSQLGGLLVSARKYVDAGLNTELLRQIADECAGGMSRFEGNPLAEARLVHQLADLYDALEEKGAAIQWFIRHWEILRQSEGAEAYPTLIALYELGWRAVDHSMARQSVDWLREAADGLDRWPKAWAEALSARKELARALSRAGRHEEAVRMFATVMEKADDSQPKLAIWLREQADALSAAGRPDEAVQVMEKAVQKLPPGDAGARSYVLSGLASLHEAQNHWDAALEASSQLVKSLETQGGPHSKMLNALIQHALLACKCPGCPGGEESARRALALARASGTRLAAAWTTWCEVLRVTHRFKESEEATREAIAHLSTTKVEVWRLRELHRRLGDLLVEQGNFEEALEEYEIAAVGVLEPDTTGRPQVNVELILSSFSRFWERAMVAGSPMADEQQRATWRAHYETWKGSRQKQAAAR